MPSSNKWLSSPTGRYLDDASNMVDQCGYRLLYPAGTPARAHLDVPRMNVETRTSSGARIAELCFMLTSGVEPHYQSSCPRKDAEISRAASAIHVRDGRHSTAQHRLGRRRPLLLPAGLALGSKIFLAPLPFGQRSSLCRLIRKQSVRRFSRTNGEGPTSA